MEIDKQDHFPEILTLVSWENEKMKVPLALLKDSEFFQNLPDFRQEVKLEMLEISTETLQKVVEFVNLAENLPKIKRPISKAEPIFPENSAFSRYFDSIDLEVLFNVILAAHKLDLKKLQKSCCAVVAQIFQRIDIENELNIEEITIDEEDFIKYTVIPRAI